MQQLFRALFILALLAFSIICAGCAADESMHRTQRCLDTLSYCPRMMELDP